MRFEAYSTQLMKYYVSNKTPEYNLDTNSVLMKIEPEDDFTRLEMYLSRDSNFYLLEEKPATHIMEDGVAIKFGKKDYDWCVNCFIYLIANIYTEQRYYVTSQSLNSEPEMTESLPTDVLVNPFQQSCYGYYVLRTKEDLVFEIQEFSGHSDMYVTV